MGLDGFDSNQENTGDKKKPIPLDKKELLKKQYGFTEKDLKSGFKAETLGYDELNERDNGYLYDTLNTYGILEQSGITSEYLRDNFGKNIPQVILGVDNREFALYSAIAEEGNLENKNGELYINTYNGMNVRHSVVIKMLDQIMQTVTVDDKGNFHGIGKIKIDTGSDKNDTELTIDFDNNTIAPPIFMNNNFGRKYPLITKNIKDFLSHYILPQDGKPALAIKTENGYKINDSYNPDGLIILNDLKETNTLTHEIHHGLFSAEPAYQKAIYERVKGTDSIQRDCATLFAASYYDVLDPDIVSTNKNIVIDEVYNAYYNEGRYDYKDCMDHRKMILGDFSKKFDIKIDLGQYDSIDQLDISQEEKDTIKTFKDMYYKESTEKDFLKNQSKDIMGKIQSVKFLYNYLQKFEPGLFARIQEARKKLVDWVDNDK